MAMALAGIMLFAGSAHAQESQPLSASALRARQVETRLQDTRLAAPQGGEDDDDPTRGWNRMKRGFYAGLVAGGIVGALIVIDCGHPECGPLFTLAAGAGAGIGLTIDLLLVPERQSGSVTAPRRHARAQPFTTGRRVAIGFRTSW
jgi:hypothetical protein